jgi:hypothetical protein
MGWTRGLRGSGKLEAHEAARPDPWIPRSGVEYKGTLSLSVPTQQERKQSKLGRRQEAGREVALSS